MPPTTKIAPLLGLVSLGAAVALVATACAGRAPGGGHAAAHPPSPLSSRTAAVSPPSTPPPPPSPSSGAIAASPSAPAGHKEGIPVAGCRATVTLVESWPGGYRGAATISNDTGRPMRGWYIQWMQPREAVLTQAWNGTHMQSGPVAMIHAPAEKPSLPPGATVSDIGFVGTAATPPTFTEITCG